jgi:hypothetical protein
MACSGTALPSLVYTVQRLPSYIIGAGTTHHVRTFTTKLVDQFLTTSVVVSDTPDGHIFTEDHPQLQWCLWMFSVFIYPCTHGKGTFTLCCTVAASFCLHTGGMHLSQDTESVLCVHVVDVHKLFYI